MECHVESGMEEALELADDDIAVERAAHQLMLQYGSRAAEVARGQARIAEDDNAERVWLKIADAIDRE
jgi:hypothetical protein